MAASDALYYLAGNFATTTIIIWIYEIFRDGPTINGFPLVLALLYIFLGRSINRDLYTDAVIFRFSTLFCLSNQPVQSNAALST